MIFNKLRKNEYYIDIMYFINIIMSNINVMGDIYYIKYLLVAFFFALFEFFFLF